MADLPDSSELTPAINQAVAGDHNQVIGQATDSTIVNFVGEGQMINLSIHDRIPEQVVPPAINAERPLSHREYRQRKVLLHKVKEYWIKGVLEASLHTQALVELGLEERASAVQHPFLEEKEFPETTGKVLPQGTNVTNIFNQMGEGRTLLILGEPGSGKTIMLLKLAQDLITRAEEDLSQPLPVVFNLSSWVKKQQSIEKWLVQELSEKYQVSKTLGKIWVETEVIVVLLDGLDEVKVEYRNACVHALNQFIQTHGLIELAVCCRVQDYQNLTGRLKLRSAIYIQPLTSEQIQRYLDRSGPQLSGLKTVLQQDEKLRELATSPLLISIMSLTYRNDSFEQSHKTTNTINEQYYQLFNAYIERMFQRRGVVQQHTKVQTLHWLSWLAQQMLHTSQTLFFIERLQPDWLRNQVEKIAYRLVLFVIGGLTTGIMFGSVFGLTYSFVDGVTAGLIFGVIFGLILGFYSDIIKPVETLKWSWKPAIKSLIVWLLVGLVSGSAGGLLYSFIIQSLFLPWVILGSADGFIGGILLGLGGGLDGLEIESKVLPNQGIRRSVKNSIVFVLVGCCIGILVSSFVKLFGQQSEAIRQLAVLHGLSSGIIVGFLSGGGRACLQHFTLRIIFWFNKAIPWNYARFLDYTAERLFLQKVGGGYIFVHRMLLEHFAAMSLEQEKY
jgi:hypothetical protein